MGLFAHLSQVFYVSLSNEFEQSYTTPYKNLTKTVLKQQTVINFLAVCGLPFTVFIQTVETLRVQYTTAIPRGPTICPRRLFVDEKSTVRYCNIIYRLNNVWSRVSYIIFLARKSELFVFAGTQMNPKRHLLTTRSIISPFSLLIQCSAI